MSLDLTIRNRQRTRAVDLRFVRRVAKTLLGELLQVEQAELGISLVGTPEMTQLNEAFLRHTGPTDVITFDHSDPAPRTTHYAAALHGEIFICVDEAIAQARQFCTTWQSEIVRYAIHGVLHLLGHDDTLPAARRSMKREENRLLRLLAQRFAFGKLSL